MKKGISPHELWGKNFRELHKYWDHSLLRDNTGATEEQIIELLNDARLHCTWEAVLLKLNFPIVRKTKNGSLRLKCPFHASDHDTIQVWAASERFKCFSCGMEGSKVDFVYLFRYKISWNELVHFFETCFPGNYDQLTLSFE